MFVLRIVFLPVSNHSNNKTTISKACSTVRISTKAPKTCFV